MGRPPDGGRRVVRRRDTGNSGRNLQEQNGPDPGKECTYCNKCLINDLVNPLGCYELSRYDGATFEEKYDNMIATVMSVFEPPAYS